MSQTDPDPVTMPVCDRCGRERRPWPLRRGDKCSPKDWAICIRQIPEDDTL